MLFIFLTDGIPIATEAKNKVGIAILTPSIVNRCGHQNATAMHLIAWLNRLRR